MYVCASSVRGVHVTTAMQSAPVQSDGSRKQPFVVPQPLRSIVTVLATTGVVAASYENNKCNVFCLNSTNLLTGVATAYAEAKRRLTDALTGGGVAPEESVIFEDSTFTQYTIFVCTTVALSTWRAFLY